MQAAVIVGEPTSNHPYIGHKGALYINAVTTGITAHSSMPHLGDNAIYKAAGAILKAKDFNFRGGKGSSARISDNQCRQDERRNEYKLST